MNNFQRNIIRQLPQFDEDSFKYFVDDNQEKVAALCLDKNCTINNSFNGAVDVEYHRAAYCLKNCGFKCIGVTEGTYKTR